MTDARRPSRVWVMLVALLLLVPPGLVVAQDTDLALADDLPPVRIDALEGASWSVDRVVAAPGQRLVITNRDVERHRFTISEWGVDVDLPILEPVTVEVPHAANPGTSFLYYSSEGDDRQQGMTGTIHVVTLEQMAASAQHRDTVNAAVTNRAVVEVTDAFQFSPSELEVAAGSMIEVQNTGAIEHHFVLDEWDINLTVPPGETAIVQVPSELTAGDAFEFYCSVPGHADLGMRGSLTIVPGAEGVTVLPIERVPGGESADLQPFLPSPDLLGEEWSHIRSGNARSMISGGVEFNPRVFPGDGIGAVYTGPAGARATVIVMPLNTVTLPANQVEGAVGAVQRSMMSSWSTDRLSGVAARDLPPPSGCDVAMRASGIVPVLTLPAASTVCELRSAGVAIFVTIEGELDGERGIAASDALVARLLSGGTGDSLSFGADWSRGM